MKEVKYVKFTMYKGSSVQLIADFSSKTMEVRRQCNDIFKVIKKKEITPFSEELYIQQNHSSIMKILINFQII